MISSSWLFVSLDRRLSAEWLRRAEPGRLSPLSYNAEPREDLESRSLKEVPRPRLGDLLFLVGKVAVSATKQQTNPPTFRFSDFE